MNRAIYKFPIEVEDRQMILMPVGAEILTVQTQGAQPCIWAMVDTGEERKVSRMIATIGTGHPVADDVQVNAYIGTYQMIGGGLIFHVFEIK